MSVQTNVLKCDNLFQIVKGVVMVVIIWWLDLHLPMQLVPIVTDVVSSNLDQGEVCNIM